MSFRYLYFLAFAFVLLSSCRHDGELAFNKIVGTWLMEDNSQYEQWRENMDGSFRSKMFSISGKDTAIAEEAEIYKKEKQWHFKVLVKGQNNGSPVIFSAKDVSDSVVQFENSRHDFPKIINYRLLPGDKMRVFIAGASDTVYFNFKRVN